MIEANGFWNEGEIFNDTNGDGAWNEGEDFTDEFSDTVVINFRND